MTHTDELIEPHEAELRNLLERTMSDTSAPTGIRPHALRHGRRLRTRRRVGIAAGAVAAGVAAALILPVALGGGSTTVIDPAGDPSNSATEPSQESRESSPKAGGACRPPTWCRQSRRSFPTA